MMMTPTKRRLRHNNYRAVEEECQDEKAREVNETERMSLILPFFLRYNDHRLRSQQDSQLNIVRTVLFECAKDTPRKQHKKSLERS